ncbi:Dnaj homolog subfamily c member 12 [Plakobranchus ocellatus]|uniref:Dnaj homolog subfamily c member 12 n=1 Tax=Plakobranchus ocellatus TaxID=259542 RepID=A0AAV4D1L1_9GAST|nr:Dnaj homolog subfamily c member 12 [Plakobranchus ocellatus]
MEYSRAIDDILSSAKKPEDDFYFILGCDETSSEEQISTEYKARVLSCHPDKHPHDREAHEKFSKLSRAKETLLDPDKRKDYDKWRRSEIALPYDTWRSMAHVKTSMHWGVHKPQAAINHSTDNSQETKRNQSNMVGDREESESLTQLKEKMKFTRRENQNPANTVSGWERDTSNPMLEKFRNYQI